MTATTANKQDAGQFVADESKVALPLRADTFLGVCEAVGQDMGFNPNYLRVVFAALIMVNPALTVGAYLALGAVVAVSRWKYPVERRQSATGTKTAATVKTAENGADDSDERLAA